MANKTELPEHFLPLRIQFFSFQQAMAAVFCLASPPVWSIRSDKQTKAASENKADQKFYIYELSGMTELDLWGFQVNGAYLRNEPVYQLVGHHH